MAQGTGIQPSFDLTDRDFDAVKLRLQGLIRSVFPTWTDFNTASFGTILLDLYAFVLDVLGFYQENQAGEAFWPTATQRQSLLRLAKLIGYDVPGATAAQAYVTLTLAAPPAAMVTIAAGRTMRTAEVTEPIVFQILADATIAAGQNPPTANFLVEHSITHEDTFASTGLPNQQIILGATPFIDGSAVITAGNGTYTPAPENNFLASTQNDRHYTLTVDNNDRATITFGNGTAGAIPVGTITAVWKTGGGSAGNVEASAISKFDGELVDANGNIVQPTVTNADRANGGADRASVEQIRQLAPLTLRVQNRTVSREDYEINARKVPNVARALMATSNEDPGIEENTGHLYIVPKGGGLPSAALKAAVLQMVTVTYPNTLTFQVEVHDPVYFPLNIEMTVYRAPRATKAQTGAAIRAALATFFAISNADGTPNERINFGFNYQNTAGTPDGVIPIDQVFNVVRDLVVIRRMGDRDQDFLVNGRRRDIKVTTNQFPTLGTLRIVDGDDGGLL